MIIKIVLGILYVFIGMVAVSILSCTDKYEPYQFILWVVISEGILTLIIFGACLLTLGGGI